MPQHRSYRLGVSTGLSLSISERLGSEKGDEVEKSNTIKGGDPRVSPGAVTDVNSQRFRITWFDSEALSGVSLRA